MYKRQAQTLPLCSFSSVVYSPDKGLRQMTILLNSCMDPPSWKYPLCEMGVPANQTRLDERQAHIKIASLLNVTLAFQNVLCPSGHVTHSFLACDVISKCYAEDNVYYGRTRESWDIPSARSCRAPLTSLPPAFECASVVQRVPYSLVCDYRQDCQDNSDEDFCVFPQCTGDTPLQCDNQQVT